MYYSGFELHFNDGRQGGVVGFMMRYNVGHVISSFVNEFVSIALTIVLFRTSRLKLQHNIANNTILHCKDLQVRLGGDVFEALLDRQSKISFLILHSEIELLSGRFSLQVSKDLAFASTTTTFWPALTFMA